MPTLNVAGWCDQEDFYGPLKIYETARKARHERTRTSSSSARGTTAAGRAARATSSARSTFDSDTGQVLPGQDRRRRCSPLSQGQGPATSPGGRDVPDRQRTRGSRTTAGRRRGATPAAALLARRTASSRSSRPPPTTNDPAFDEYVSDPANPVPYRPRPVTPTYPGPEWQVWMVQDQRSPTTGPTC